MKKDIHPELKEVTAHCACGHEFETRTTSKDLKVTICSHCHPFYTGDQKYVDTAGRIEKFQKKFKKSLK
ncbi:MAG: 50S ribosomal protein L31 [bacterium]|nr:50S ribosomal protein L31 [bacterium]